MSGSLAAFTAPRQLEFRRFVGSFISRPSWAVALVDLQAGSIVVTLRLDGVGPDAAGAQGGRRCCLCIEARIRSSAVNLRFCVVLDGNRLPACLFLFQVTVQNQRKHPLLLSSSPAAHGACLHLCVCVCVIKLAYRYNNVTDHIDLVIRIFLL